MHNIARANTVPITLVTITKTIIRTAPIKKNHTQSTIIVIATNTTQTTNQIKSNQISNQIHMLDLVAVFHRGGLILWSAQAAAPTSSSLTAAAGAAGAAGAGALASAPSFGFLPLNQLIQTILLQERTAETSFMFGSNNEYTVKWCLENQLHLVFVVVYLNLQPLLFSVEELLNAVRDEFVENAARWSEGAISSSGLSSSMYGRKLCLLSPSIFDRFTPRYASILQKFEMESFEKKNFEKLQKKPRTFAETKRATELDVASSRMSAKKKKKLAQQQQQQQQSGSKKPAKKNNANTRASASHNDGDEAEDDNNDEEEDEDEDEEDTSEETQEQGGGQAEEVEKKRASEPPIPNGTTKFAASAASSAASTNINGAANSKNNDHANGKKSGSDNYDDDDGQDKEAEEVNEITELNTPEDLAKMFGLTTASSMRGRGGMKRGGGPRRIPKDKPNKPLPPTKKPGWKVNQDDTPLESLDFTKKNGKSSAPNADDTQAKLEKYAGAEGLVCCCCWCCCCWLWRDLRDLIALALLMLQFGEIVMVSECK